jgi:hypothetical protein
MKTQKRRHINKPYTVFQKGNILICVRIPISKPKKRNIKGGKDNDNTYLQTEIFQNMVSILRGDDADTKILKQYLESQNMSTDKANLLQFVFSKKNEMEYEDLFKAIETRKLNMRDYSTDGRPENKLYKLLLTKVQAKNAIEKIKEEVNAIPNMDEKTKVSIINSLENGSGMSVSSISSGAFNTLKNGSVALAGFFAPPPVTNKKQKWNETSVEILFFDKDHLHYKKGDSQVPIKPEEKNFGDFMIINRPTKYANTSEYFSKMFGSVEDLLAHIATPGENLLCSGNSEKCKKYSVKPKPYTRRIMRIVDKKVDKS